MTQDLELDLAAACIRSEPQASARLLESMTTDTAAELLARLDVETAAAALPHIVPTAAAASLLLAVPDGRRAELLAVLPPRAAARLLGALPAGTRAACIETLPETRRREVALLADYPTGSAGAAMQPAALAVPATCTVRDAVARVADADGPAHTQLYVVGEHGVLTGQLTLRELMTAPPDRRVGDVALEAKHAVRARMPVADAFAAPTARAAGEVPVVDRDGALRGVLRLEDCEPDALQSARPREGLGDLALSAAELYWSALSALLLPAATVPREKAP